MYTAITGTGGQVFFLRPLTLNTSHSMISQIDLDVTVNAKGGVFTQAPILNYTLTMPIEQVQQLLGHAKIDTTMHYAMVSQNNVKISHRKYIG